MVNVFKLQTRANFNFKLFFIAKSARVCEIQYDIHCLSND